MCYQSFPNCLIESLLCPHILTVSSIQQVPVAVKKPDHSHFGSKSEYESNKQQEVCDISLSFSSMLSHFNTLLSHSVPLQIQKSVSARMEYTSKLEQDDMEGVDENEWQE